MSDCIFCKIAAGEIPAKTVYEDEYMKCFYDLDPQAPVHVLVIPKRHAGSIGELCAEDMPGIDAIMAKIGDIAEELGISQAGYRVVINTGEAAGQSVRHLHFHILGGRSMQWPPG